MTNEAAVQRIEAGMPAPSFDTSLRSKRELGLVLGIHGPHCPRGRQIANGFVRLIEKTILEYLLCRQRLIAFLREGVADDHFRAQDHFETSLQSLHRSIAYLDRLRNMGFRRADGALFIPRPREIEVLRDSVRLKIRKLRNLVEHLDDDIMKGRILQDANVGVHLGWEKATLGGVEVTYIDFARWMGQLHNFAELLSRVEITVASTGGKQVRSPSIQN